MLMFVVVNIHLQSTAEADGYVIRSTSEPDLFTPSKSVTKKITKVDLMVALELRAPFQPGWKCGTNKLAYSESVKQYQ